ncbi:MAG: helicase [Chlamydiae bacterium GWC2_50_10]|nr:MAG: helicase [Chlamydiae bacterium GWA2_50_15]OGN54118.1 MAG: helicase [Chlamydiae bacterium GWC2_50_10]OGN55017.1 MAG: helicase [Chlamydiae bacterium GWF2_49_8]OGN64273.1 MAG: helicase [Chlamydiae bacterium RIFCSPHIGHO2_12_FULL_49_32]OGN72298.1 MAG: helicase [Chlamydiae bacterium RIFCSPLOWO2_12_FULL_49_12]HCJ83886.1 helicase [Parachlamydiales bacterium]
MFNFRKLKQDFSSSIVKEGKDLYDEKKVLSAKILHLDQKSVRFSGRIVGQYDNTYESEIEIDRQECDTIDSDCDCPYNYDCHHLAALLFYLEQHLDQILVCYSQERGLENLSDNQEAHEEILEKVKEAKTKAEQKQEELNQQQLLQEYLLSSQALASSPFFQIPEKKEIDRADVSLLFNIEALSEEKGLKPVEVQLALRLPFRSKPFYVPQVKNFLRALCYEESLFLGGRRYTFSIASFDERMQGAMRTLCDHAFFPKTPSSEKGQRIAFLDRELFGMLLSGLFQRAFKELASFSEEDELPSLPCCFLGSFDTPLRFAPQAAALLFHLEYMKPPISKILIEPKIQVNQAVIRPEEAFFFECASPGMLFGDTYYRFLPSITCAHLRSLIGMRDLTIPEPLFGTFVENALPELAKHGEVCNQRAIEHFVTLPYVGAVEASCELAYLEGELDATLFFHYDKQKIPASFRHLNYNDVTAFITEQGILARNLVEEKKIIEDLFQDFLLDEEQGRFSMKSDKKIVEFMTDVIPRNQHRVKFHCPQNLLDRFIYDQTSFELHLIHTERVDHYLLELKVKGALEGVRLDMLWECMASKRSFIELTEGKGKQAPTGRLSKILVLDLDRISPVIQLFDEMGIDVLENHSIPCPLWSLATLDADLFKGLPIKFSMSKRLKEIRQQMLGEKSFTASLIPKAIRAHLRPYQTEGIQWLERLRSMYLSGILADDMGLGKTLQAIVALAQDREKKRAPHLIICPTSLLYNWKEEYAKFHPDAKVLVVDGVPTYRRKLIETIGDYDVVITSYTLLQKDIEIYKEIPLSYAVLDEAQHIKNRGTRNAKSTKMIQASHRLILSGTPIENSLEELWSLFDFLMPGFLSSYERFLEKYVRVSGFEQAKNLEYLKKKVSPFILRRMKTDVLKDLPPVSENVYHCQLSETQLELYRSYAQSARDELVKLVQRDGFDRVQIHVLATLTRLKQICCHPAIFAKESAEAGDSAKYDMLLELLRTLIEGEHKTVIFSQYTRMLQIMQKDFVQMGIPFAYLDGSTKNRLEVVKRFNEDSSLSVFLVSLKAGGTGLNLVGADTVIHYDMWWNPAVENQATDRVHRIGQKSSVSSYKLITLGTIEEKIAEMQSRKKGLVKKIVSCDDEAISKLTWEDVLELLKT